MNMSVSQKHILSIEAARRAIVRSVIQWEKPVMGTKKLVCQVIATRKEEKKVVRRGVKEGIATESANGWGAKDTRPYALSISLVVRTLCSRAKRRIST